ncbi:hypothetical protein LTS08_001690 [Lithohypha guttulata]|nr:hypothetical protein LTS08_001690 [Lithohypha guttulata]
MALFASHEDYSVVKPRQAQLKQIPASTITPEERRIFERIRQQFGDTVDDSISSTSTTSPASQSDGSSSLPKPVLESAISDSSEDHLHDIDVSHILSLFAPNTYQPFNNTANDLISETTDAEPTVPQTMPSHQIRAAALATLENITSSFRTALTSRTTPPDQALWKVIENDVLRMIDLLHHPALRLPQTTSQSPTGFHNPYQLTLGDISSSPTSSTSPQPVLVSSLANVPTNTPLLPLITILYPAATLLALRMYAAYLPTSGFALALLPRIKSLGATSYLLAGTSHFFNTLLQLYWEVYSDIDALQSLIRDMRRDGVEYDERTIELLERVPQARRNVMKKDKTDVGDRAREWWQMKAQSDGLAKLLHTQNRIKHDMEKKAREKDSARLEDVELD